MENTDFKIDNIDEKAYKDLLNQIFSNKKEERDLAMDRYRKADELMGGANDGNNFLMHGRNSVEYLALAAEITNSLVQISKDMKSIVFKNSEGGSKNGGGMSDEDAKKIEAILSRDAKDGKLD